MELSDETVTLRSTVEADATDVAAAVRASLPTLRPWMPWATDNYGPDDAIQWITGAIDPTAVQFVIVDPDGSIAGAAGLNRFDRPNRRANLGYWLRPDRTGRGYATAATSLIAAHGLDDLALERVEVIMPVDNEPSRRVAQRAGALYEGILHRRLRLGERQHDVHSFAFLATGPRP